jgi:hypothetical protein
MSRTGRPRFAGERIGVIVDMEERRATFGPEFYVRARFRDFITPWTEAWKLARVS